MYWIILLIIAYILNLYFTFLQMEKYKKTIVKLKKDYRECYITTGKSRKLFKGGSVSILVISKDESIKYGEQMKGRTVFADFKPIEGVVGMTVDDVEKNENEDSIIQAISFYKEYMSLNKSN